MENFANFRTLTTKDVLRIILRRKWLILLLFISVTGTTAVLSDLAPKIYRSEAKIMLKWENKDVIILTPQSTYSTHQNRAEQLNSEVELIKSLEVAEETFRLAYDRADSPLSGEDSSMVFRIKNSISARAVKNANMIQIAYEDTRPVLAAKMVSTVINAYKIFRNEIYAGIDDYDFLKQQITLNKKKLNELRSRLDNYRIDKNIVSLDAQKNQILTQLSNVETELFEVSRQRIKEETLLTQFQKLRAGSNIGGLHLSNGSADWSNAQKLYSKWMELRMQRAQLLEQYTEEYDKVKAINEEITTIKSMLDKETDRLFRIEETALQGLRVDEQVLREKAASLRAQLKQLPTVEQQLTNLSRDIQEYEKIHTTLLQKKEEKRLSAAQSLEELTIKVINPAIVPRTPIRPNVRFNVSLAAVLSLLTGIGLAFFLDYSNNTIRTVEDVEQIAGLPVLTTLRDLGKLNLNGSGKAKKKSRRLRPY